jgi:hypothetical protein
MQHVHADTAGAIKGATKNETPAVAAARGSEDQGLTSSLDCRGPDAVGQADKAFATLRARLALAGYALHITSNGTGGAEYIVTRWNLCRTLPDIAAVSALADQVGGCTHA